jgi:hypothetical protein
MHAAILQHKTSLASILTATAQKMRGYITAVHVPLIFLVLS